MFDILSQYKIERSMSRELYNGRLWHICHSRRQRQDLCYKNIFRRAMKQRQQIWNDISTTGDCDVLILGGGVNGTSLFRDLAMQGIRCILVDKEDFTAGASSKSSRMIHGGLRYLENREFKLVSESVSERNRLLRCACHYVAPLKTSIPVDSWFAGLIRTPLVFFGLPVKVGGRGALIFKMGLSFYDFITRKRRQTPCHYFQSKAKSLQEIPGLREDIACTATYWDAWVSQIERLCVEMVQEGNRENPNCLAINYISASKEGKDQVLLKDQLTGEQVTIKPKLVVNATGAWVDMANKTLGVESKFMGGTKGSHLVIDNQGLYDALGDRMIYYEHSDGRICIAFRFMDKVIMGSTDISLDNPDDAECEDSEIDYMMTTLKGVFPGIKLSNDDIVFTFCGVRPLAASGLDFTSRASRAHRIEVSEPDSQRDFKIYSMIGGKLTTFGVFAQQTAEMVLSQLGKTNTVSTLERPYLGAIDYPADDTAKENWVARVAKANDLTLKRVADLLERYGTEAEKIASEKEESLRAPLAELPEYTVGEILYIVKNECIGHLSDLIRRRSLIALLGNATEAAVQELANITADALNWDQQRKENEIRMALTEAGDRK